MSRQGYLLLVDKVLTNNLYRTEIIGFIYCNYLDNTQKMGAINYGRGKKNVGQFL